MRESDLPAYVPEIPTPDMNDVERVRQAKEQKLHTSIVSGTIAAIALVWAPFAYTHVANSSWGHENMGADAGWAGIAILALAWPLAIFCCFATFVRCCTLLSRGLAQSLPWLGMCACGVVVLWMRWLVQGNH